MSSAKIVVVKQKVHRLCAIPRHHTICKHRTLLDSHRYPHHRSQPNHWLIHTDFFTGHVEKLCLVVERRQNECQAKSIFAVFMSCSLLHTLLPAHSTNPGSKSTKCISSTRYSSVSLLSPLSVRAPLKAKTPPSQRTNPNRNSARHQSTSAPMSTKDSIRDTTSSAQNGLYTKT